MTYLEHLTIPEESPMSDTQARLLWLLAAELDRPSAFNPSYSYRRAANEIAGLEDELRIMLLPPHTD